MDLSAASSQILFNTLHGNESINNQSNNTPTTLPRKFIPYFIWLLFVACVGTVGNILIMFAVVINKKLQVISNVFVVNLAAVDLFVTAVVDPFAAVGLFGNGEFFRLHPDVCSGLGAIVVISCSNSIWSILFISLERLFKICHPMIYPKLYNRRTIPFILLCLWGIAASFALPYFDPLNWLGSYEYVLQERLCTWDKGGRRYVNRLYLSLGLVVPLTIIPYCYARIYLRVRRSKQRVQSISKGRVRHNSDTKILKTIAVICAGFTIMWTPYTASVLFDFDGTWPNAYILTGLALSNSSINFVIYGVMNRNFRSSYKTICRKICCLALNCSPGTRTELSSNERTSQQRDSVV